MKNAAFVALCLLAACAVPAFGDAPNVTIRGASVEIMAVTDGQDPFATVRVISAPTGGPLSAATEIVPLLEQRTGCTVDTFTYRGGASLPASGQPVNFDLSC